MKRASTPDRSDPSQDPKDRRGSPLGRGANPGTSVERGPLRGQGIAGPRGGNVPGEKGGASGLATRENEDSVQTSRE